MSQQKVGFRKMTVAGITTIILLVGLVSVIVVYNSIISNKDSQIADLQSILDLEKQEVVLDNYAINQGANNLSAVIHRSYSYSGYLLINATSTTATAYVNLQYWFGGKLYSFTETVGTSGSAFFAIPKTESATVYVGNRNLLNGATETLTITYHY